MAIPRLPTANQPPHTRLEAQTRADGYHAWRVEGSSTVLNAALATFVRTLRERWRCQTPIAAMTATVTPIPQRTAAGDEGLTLREGPPVAVVAGSAGGAGSDGGDNGDGGSPGGNGDEGGAGGGGGAEHTKARGPAQLALFQRQTGPYASTQFKEPRRGPSTQWLYPSAEPSTQPKLPSPLALESPIL